ncbi:MAG TPA: hypothetical protein VKE74_29790 [Gemmataceae bacterium]|nr:hypothetical protein [Gemmataceae bacterium]
MARSLPLVLATGFTLALSAAPGQPAAGQKDWYEKAVKKVEAKFDPAEAKPGQTVTFTLTVQLNDGYHTYPFVQPDKNASGMVNTIKYPEPGAVVFVGPTVDPKGFVTKAVPEIGIAELREYTGTVTYTHKAVVSPKAPPGAATVKLASFKLSVCDENNCFPPKAVPVEAGLKVLDGPPVPIDPALADEVNKALAGK